MLKRFSTHRIFITFILFTLLPLSASAFDCETASEVDINSASVEALECLDGIGPTYAGRIVDGRPFNSLDDLLDVSGIGPVTLSNIKDQGLVVVDGSTEDGEGDKEISDDTKEEEKEDTSDPKREDVEDRPSSHSSPVELSVMDEPATIKISAGRDRLVSTESNVRFEVYIDSEENLPRRTEFEWALGDGSVKEGREIDHRYFASGNYSVVLTVRTRDGEAVSRVEVEVVEPEISIESANSDTVTLYNSAEQEVNLGGWDLETEGGDFTIPDNTIIGAGRELNLPSKVIGIAVEDGESVSIRSPKGGFGDSFVLEQEDIAEGSVDTEGDSETVATDGLESENRRLRHEVSLLREEVGRMAQSRNESEPRTVVAEEAQRADEDSSSVEASASRDESRSDDEEEVRADEARELKTVYDGGESEGGLWKRLLGTPSAIFGRLPF